MNHLHASPGDLITGTRTVWSARTCSYVPAIFTGRVVGRMLRWPRLPVVELGEVGSGYLLALSRMNGVDVGECVNHGPEEKVAEKGAGRQPQEVA